MSRQDKSIELKEVNAEDKKTEERKSMAADAWLSQWAKGSQGREQSESNVMEYSWNETNYYFSFDFWWIKKLSESSCFFFARLVLIMNES